MENHADFLNCGVMHMMKTASASTGAWCKMGVTNQICNTVFR